MSPFQPNRVRVVLSSMGLLPFVSIWRAAALALAELGCAAFFIVGVVQGTVGEFAPWFVLAACVLGIFARAGDIESWALFIPGGLIGRTGVSIRAHDDVIIGDDVAVFIPHNPRAGPLRYLQNVEPKHVAANGDVGDVNHRRRRGAEERDRRFFVVGEVAAGRDRPRLGLRI